MHRAFAALTRVLGIPAVLLIAGLPGRSLGQATIAAPPRYQAAVEALEPFIEREVAGKGLPALSIALVEDQTLVWAKGFGFAQPRQKLAATADTVYRIGSVSKLFTDIAIMQLVERGQLDLDGPVTRSLPDFKPANPFGKPVTLRQLMAHRSGLVREPPVGNYFDSTSPTLARTVASLNATELIYAPETRIKYSNAAIATAGYVLERTQGQPFAAHLQRAVLAPLGMKRSAFTPTLALTKDLATGTMWTYHGREFEAPTFALGIEPAGSMVSTVLDLGQFLKILFAGGQGPGGQVLKPATLEQMWTPQFAPPTEKEGFGLGFHVSTFEGRRRVGHSGAVYGFAAELAALPGEKLGVVVMASRDAANAITKRIADVALKQLLAVQQKKPLPPIEETTPVPATVVRKLPGKYRHGNQLVEVEGRSGKLYLIPLAGGVRVELRAQGDTLITDDRLDFGLRVKPKGDDLVIKGETYQRLPESKPEPVPPGWQGLIGEYGWDHNVLYILEREGKLYALIEWFLFYPLEEAGADTFKFPDNSGFYPGDKLVFMRDASGHATQVEAVGVVFPRRAIDGEHGATFRIRALRPVEELRRQALAAKPPREELSFREPDLVEVTQLDPAIKLDIRYASTNNFLSTPLYTSAKAFLQRPAAEAVVRAHRKLADQGYGLLIHDGYRPWYVTKMFWDATPEKFHLFVADPSQGSRHNRGCAVDLTLYDRKTGTAVPMVGGYDEFSDRSYPDYPGGTSLQRWHRELLRRAMEEQGFTVYEAEWWHFDYQDWKKYPIGTRTFEEIVAGKQE